MCAEYRCVVLLVVTLLLPFSLSYPADGATVGFQAAVNYTVGTAPRAVASADFNGDGKADLAVANSGVLNFVAIDDGGISVLLGNGDGTFQPANSFTAGKNPFALAASDFNRDGKADLVLIDGSGVGVLLGNGDGTFGPATYFPTASGPHSLAVSDFDNDNIPDLVVAASSLSVLMGNGDGTFKSHVDYSGSSGAIVIADVNGDGKLDLIGSLIAGVRVLLGNGDGSFQSAIFSSGPSFSVALVAADFNLEGKTDVALGFNNLIGKASGTVVKAGNGDGTFGLSPQTDLQLFGAMSAGDFNGDGKADLVIVSGPANVSGAANVFPGNGDRTFQPALSLAVGTAPYSVLEADFNHDNAPDLAVTNSADNTVGVLLNTTGADFSISASAPTPGTVSRGQSSTSTITLAHLNAFDNPVALTCSAQPTQSAPTCSFKPNSVTFDANGNATATLTISTGAAAVSVVPSTRHDSLSFRFGWLPVVGFAFMGVGFGYRLSIKRRLTVCLLGGILFSGLILQAACGGGSSGPRSQTYTITVAGASGSTQHSTTVLITVR